MKKPKGDTHILNRRRAEFPFEFGEAALGSNEWTFCDSTFSSMPSRQLIVIIAGMFGGSRKPWAEPSRIRQPLKPIK
jgi:hypothetical protein